MLALSLQGTNTWRQDQDDNGKLFLMLHEHSDSGMYYKSSCNACDLIELNVMWKITPRSATLVFSKLMHSLLAQKMKKLKGKEYLCNKWLLLSCSTMTEHWWDDSQLIKHQQNTFLQWLPHSWCHFRNWLEYTKILFFCPLGLTWILMKLTARGNQPSTSYQLSGHAARHAEKASKCSPRSQKGGRSENYWKSKMDLTALMKKWRIKNILIFSIRWRSKYKSLSTTVILKTHLGSH